MQQGDETLSIITNSAIIAVNQDSSHSPAIRIWRRPVPGSKEPYSTVSGTPSLQLWMGYLSNWEFVVALLNTGKDYVHDYEVLFEDVFFDLVSCRDFMSRFDRPFMISNRAVSGKECSECPLAHI